MAGLFLYRSNRAEHLAEALTGLLRQPIAGPLVPETVVVQSVGMRKWLSLEIAARLGVCANCRFPFPKKFVDEAFGALFGSAEEDLYYERDTMTWRIMKLLPPLVSSEAFAPVKNYLRGENGNLKQFQLSEKIAHLFDQYIVFRPEMILGWEAGKDAGDWQAILWRELAKGHPGHQAAQGKRLSDWLKHNEIPAHRLPQRLSVFGISSLPRFYIDFLGAIAETIEVHCFLLDPCRELWAHIISEAEEDAVRRRMKRASLTSADMHAENRNSLLASLGKIGRDFQDLILELKPLNDEPLFVESEREDMLSALQGDILNLRDPVEKRAMTEGDTSIQVHSCHSPMRELEVLQDQLLSLFEKRGDLLPKDIVVMMPDVKGYAPFIDAVFGCPERPERYIPFTIADRGIRAESALADTLMRVLEVAQSRFGASTVLALLESDAIQNRFNLSESEVETIRTWVEKVGIRWGIDGAHRKNLGLPDSDQNTWRAGLRRLLLGYALPARNEKLFETILPFDDVEGGYAETLGNFVGFIEKLFALATTLQRPHTLAEWEALLLETVEQFFVVDEDTTAELHLIRQAISTLGKTAELAEFDENVPAEVILAHIGAALDNQDTGNGFMAGQVTFCALRPMRSIPFAVVCLIGMNDGSYPRHHSAPAFDKIAAEPKRGDRSTRHDDRYLFLEAILSARDHLYISYVGQSIKDNSLLTPSVLVSELLDYIDRSFEFPGKSLLEEHLITRQRLQAFSASYFSGDRLFSYSSENCAASRAALEDRQVPPVFLERELPEPDAEFLNVPLDTLVKFLCGPAEFFLRNRLGITLRKPDALLSERENFDLDGLTGYTARTFLADKQLAGMPSDSAVSLLKAMGHLPHGSFGDCHSFTLSDDANTFLAQLRPYTTDGPLPDLSFERNISKWDVTGAVRGVYRNHVLRYRCADLKARDVLKTWVQHLAWNIVEPGKPSILVSLDRVVTFQPVENPEQLLEQLLQQYWAGLRQPLKFFPETSFDFARRTHRPGSREKLSPRRAAENLWTNDSDFAESKDANIELCFRGVENVLDEDWERLADVICAPMILNSTEEKV